MRTTLVIGVRPSDEFAAHAWIELDGTYDLGPGPHIPNETAQERYALSRCMTCGCCLEACPQSGDDNYIGPQAIAQARLLLLREATETLAWRKRQGYRQTAQTLHIYVELLDRLSNSNRLS